VHSADPFVLVFSRLFEGRQIYHQLQHLELPWRVLTQDSAATVVKSAPKERGAGGGWLKRIGLSDNAGERDKIVGLKSFRGLSCHKGAEFSFQYSGGFDGKTVDHFFSLRDCLPLWYPPGWVSNIVSRR